MQNVTWPAPMGFAFGLDKIATRKSQAENVSKATKTSSADGISFVSGITHPPPLILELQLAFSSCKDDQTSAGAQENGELTGPHVCFVSLNARFRP